MMKPCRKCGRLVPAHLWATHKQAHHNATKPRQPDAEWWRIRRRVLKAKHERCQKCGRTQAQLAQAHVALHVHHINGNPRDNRMANLALLCSDCHPRGGDRPYGVT
jgi:5-methylcytosine-specific restriction endonuclease McrA